MKKRLKAFSRTTIALLTAALVCSPFTKAYADDTVDSLEKQTNGLQNQLDSLNQDLTSLSAEITDLASKIEDTDASVQKAELDLAAAKLDEQLQYDDARKGVGIAKEPRGCPFRAAAGRIFSCFAVNGKSASRVHIGALVRLCRRLTVDIFQFHPHPYGMRLKLEGLSHLS